MGFFLSFQISYREGSLPYTCTHIHILVFFPTDMGGASLEGLCKTPLYKGLYYGGFCKAPQSSYREGLR